MGWLRSMPDEEHSSDILLSFRCLFNGISTKEFRFEETLSVFDAPTLSGLRNLSQRRDAALLGAARRPGADLEELEKSLLQYAACVDGYASTVFSSMANMEKARVLLEWTSPLSEAQLGQHFPVAHPAADAIMALVLCADTVRRQAACRLAALVHPPTNWDEVSPEGPELLHGTAAKLLRRAAGILAEASARAKAAGEHLPRERPAALQPAMLAALEQACLGEAQAVMADRAERKHSPPALVAGLYRAASALFEGAAAALRRSSRDFSHGVSPLARRYLAVSASLNECRARRCAAGGLHAQAHSGRALALLRDAERTLADCVAVAERESQWVEALQAERSKAAELAAACERDRRAINFEPVPGVAPGLPEAKRIVESALFEGLPAPELVFY